MSRKQHVTTTTEEVVALVQRAGVTSPAKVAETLGCSVASARRKLDGGFARGDLIRDEFDADGRPLTHPHWRYGSAS
jgi:predicted ArsR family transcriptional regulator